MKMKFLSVVSLMLLSACTVNHGDFTVLSNKIVSTQDFDMGTSQRIRNVEGEDMAHMIIIFPTGTPRLEAALNDAFEKNRYGCYDRCNSSKLVLVDTIHLWKYGMESNRRCGENKS